MSLSENGSELDPRFRPVIVDGLRITNAYAATAGGVRGAFSLLARKGMSSLRTGEAFATLSTKAKSGKYQTLHPIDVVAYVIDELLERYPKAAPLVEEVSLGCVTQVDRQALNPGRFGALVSDKLGKLIAGSTHSRLCASGMEAISSAHGKILAGAADVVVAAGVEDMSNQPIGRDNLVPSEKLRARLPVQLQHHAADNMAKHFGLKRGELDAYAILSHARCIKAQQNDAFPYVIPLKMANGSGAVELLRTDQPVRSPFPDDESISSSEADWLNSGWFQKAVHKYGKRRRVLGTDSVTGYNSSAIVDGASCLLMMSLQKARELGLTPMAEIVGQTQVGSDPRLMLTGPMPATEKLFKRSGLELDAVDTFLVNEAFAHVPCAYMKHFGIDSKRVNPRGGAIAMGHPLGSTGVQLTIEACYDLQNEDVNNVLVVMCVGAGQGQIFHLRKVK